jgi:8-oxo-dGTP pyrophosphatase MutT (NUDIX family)
MANTPEWLLPRSGAIPFFIDASGLQVVLVTTKSQDNKRWIFPKGKIETGLSASDSAAKEAYEEAGVRGQIQPSLFATYNHTQWGGKVAVRVFLLEVSEILQTWPDRKKRDRAVVSLEEAIARVHPEQKQILRQLQAQRQELASKAPR